VTPFKTLFALIQGRLRSKRDSRYYTAVRSFSLQLESKKDKRQADTTSKLG
jgi:hypothetical protein